MNGYIGPESFSVMQARLNTMIGKSSGFVETLPKQVQARIQALRKLQEKHDDAETEYQKELKALQDKYNAIYGVRCAIYEIEKCMHVLL